jgi:hypothetical protein
MLERNIDASDMFLGVVVACELNEFAGFQGYRVQWSHEPADRAYWWAIYTGYLAPADCLADDGADDNVAVE